MSIVSSVVAEDGAEQGNTGVKFIRFEFTDHEGVVHTHFRYKKYPVATNAEAERVSLIPELESILDEGEQKQAWFADNPLDLVLTPSHSTQRKIARYVIRRLMRSDELEDIRRCKPLLKYMDANLTDAQIRTLLGITAAQLVKLRAKGAAVFTTTHSGETFEQIEDAIRAGMIVENWYA